MEYNIQTPFTKEKIEALRAGDSVLITGIIYTARDAAHERMVNNFRKDGVFPIDMKDAVIYYAGPCPAKPGEVIGSCGPTTAGRMDAYAPVLLDNGLGVMIGKGVRNQNVIEAMKRNKCVYLGATGGAGALISESIKKSEVIAYDDLGTEAIRRLTVVSFPTVVLIDCMGNNLYTEERSKYRKI